MVFLSFDGTVLEQAVRELLHEERIPCGPLQDQVSELRGYLTPFQDRLHELSTGFQSQLIQTNPVEVTLAPPLMGVLGPVEEDEGYSHIGKPANEVIQKLLCGLVDPVEILDGKNEKPL